MADWFLLEHSNERFWPCTHMHIYIVLMVYSECSQANYRKHFEQYTAVANLCVWHACFSNINNDRHIACDLENRITWMYYVYRSIDVNILSIEMPKRNYRIHEISHSLVDSCEYVVNMYFYVCGMGSMKQRTHFILSNKSIINIEWMKTTKIIQAHW